MQKVKVYHRLIRVGAFFAAISKALLVPSSARMARVIDSIALVPHPPRRVSSTPSPHPLQTPSTPSAHTPLSGLLAPSLIRDEDCDGMSLEPSAPDPAPPRPRPLLCQPQAQQDSRIATSSAGATVHAASRGAAPRLHLFMPPPSPFSRMLVASTDCMRAPV